MYNYPIIILCIIFIIISIRKKKVFLSPIFIIGTIWALILILESLHLYDINIVRTRIYEIIFWGIIAFVIGYSIVCIFKKRYKLSIYSPQKRSSIENDMVYVPRYKLLCFIGVICILFYLKGIPAIVSILINGGGLDSIREMVQNPESAINIRSNIENAIRILIIIPSSLAIEVIVAIDFWFGKRHKGLLSLSIIIIILRVITEGGRTPIVNFLLYMVIGFIFISFKSKRYNINKFKSKFKKRYIVLIIIMGVLLLYYTTISRSGQDSLRTTYYYFAMEPYMFDIWAQFAEESNLIGYGVASLNGFIFPILYILKNFLGIPFPEQWANIYDMILLTDSQWRVITTTGIRANAYVSMFWFFYVDGRIYGVILGMFTYGMIVANYFMNAIKQVTAKNVCIYALIVQGLLFSFIRFPFSNLYYALAFLFVQFIAYRKEFKAK